MTKLAIFGPLPPPYTGMETMTLTLLTELRAHDAELGLIFRHVDTQVNRSQRERERFHRHKLAALLRQAAQSLTLACHGFDAYYPISQNRIGFLRDLVLLIPSRLLRRSVTLHLHGSALDTVLEQEPMWVALLLRLAISRRRARGIVLTSSLVHCLAPLVKANRIAVVANTVLEPPPDARDVRPEAPPLRVLFVGTLMLAKGYRELTEAVCRMADQGIAIELELAGEPLTREDVEWIHAFEFTPSVTFCGPLTGGAKWTALRTAHVIVVPSTAAEGQPLVLLEGMAAGCAVVGTARGGIEETIGSAGITLPPTEGEQLIASLTGVLSWLALDLKMTLQLGREARARFEEYFSRPQFIRAWLEAFGIHQSKAHEFAPVDHA